MNYLQQLRLIESEVYKNMGKASQKTIDIVEESIISIDKEEDVSSDEIGSICYDIDIILEVFNPELEFDIDILKRFHKILESWYYSLSTNIN